MIFAIYREGLVDGKIVAERVTNYGQRLGFKTAQNAYDCIAQMLRKNPVFDGSQLVVKESQ